MCRINRLTVTTEMPEIPLDRRLVLPHRRQTSMSMAKTRLRRCAQVNARCRSATDGSPLSLNHLESWATVLTPGMGKPPCHHHVTIDAE
jgi:hypothetical protein